MHKLYYCLDCKRVFSSEEKCDYCQSNKVKEVKKNCPVNILGTKQKGRVLKVTNDAASILLISEANETYVKDYPAENLKKVL